VSQNIPVDSGLCLIGGEEIQNFFFSIKETNNEGMYYLVGAE
jgi:hypothetical protein